MMIGLKQNNIYYKGSGQLKRFSAELWQEEEI